MGPLAQIVSGVLTPVSSGSGAQKFQLGKTVGKDTPFSPLVLPSRVAMSILALAVEETTGSRLVLLLLWMDNMGLLALSEL